MTDSIPETDQPETPRRRGVFGFLFKSTLGCASFALGVLVVLLLLVPTLASGTVAKFVKSGFDTRYHGRLEIEKVELAWFSAQTVRGARIVDPGGAEVARASVTLPSLWSLSSAKSGNVGTVVVDVQADLVADDAGVTNLQRAMAPRAVQPDENGDSAEDSSTFDVGEFLRKLDLDLRVNIAHATWSDAETRRLGARFEIRSGVVTAVAKPGQPIVVHVGGDLAGDSAGVLEIDAKIHGPIDMRAAWPLGKTVAEGRVERFSTAMVDGIAGLSGDLVEVLGPNFTLRFDASAESSQRAAVDLTLDGARAGLALHARLADGQITAIEKPFLVASAPFPRKILERIAGSKLPPDARLELTDVGQPWTARISRLRIPVPKSAGADLASLQPALEAAEIVMDVDLPGSIALETDALRAANITAGISAIQLTARATPGNPLIVHFEAQLDAGAPGRARVDVTVPQAFGMLAGGPIPRVDAKVEVEGLSTLALGELAGQGDRIAQAIGPVLRVEVDAKKANLEGGSVRVALEAEQLRADVPLRMQGGGLQTQDEPARIEWTPTAEFLVAEVGPRLPEGAHLDFDGPLVVEITMLGVDLMEPTSKSLRETDAILASLRASITANLPIVRWNSPPKAGDSGAAVPAVSLTAARLQLDVSGAGAQSLIFTSELGATEAAAVPALVVNARVADSLVALTKLEGLPHGDASVSLHQVDTRFLGEIAGVADLLEPLFGTKLDVQITADSSDPVNRPISARIAGDAGSMMLNASLRGDRIVSTGEAGLDAKLRITTEFLTAQLGDSLPAGTRVAIAGGAAGELNVKLRDFATPLEAPDVAQRIAATRAHLEVTLPAITYADAKTDLVGKPAVLSGTKLTVSMTPETRPILRLESSIADTPPGTIDVEITALDPLENLTAEGGWKTYRTSSRVNIANVPTALADALAGQDGLLVEALGPRLAVQFDAADLSYQRGAFATKLAGGQNKLALEGRLEDGALLVDKADGLDADLALGPLVMDRVVGRLLPILRKASFLVPVEASELTSSAQLAPFLVNSSNVRFALDGDVSKLNATFRIDLGTLSFQGLPMLEQLGVSLNAAEVRLPAFTVPIRDGVAYYDKLPIRIAGRDILFAGNVRLTDGEMALTTSLPLALLGKQVTRELDKVRDFLPPDTTIPVELRGTWNKPRLAFQEGFLSGLIEKAAGKAAQDGLDGLLDGLLGGKKKKGGG